MTAKKKIIIIKSIMCFLTGFSISCSILAGTKFNWCMTGIAIGTTVSVFSFFYMPRKIRNEYNEIIDDQTQMLKQMSNAMIEMQESASKVMELMRSKSN